MGTFGKMPLDLQRFRALNVGKVTKFYLLGCQRERGRGFRLSCFVYLKFWGAVRFCLLGGFFDFASFFVVLGIRTKGC